ncbi:MAG: hypothetical protein GY756_05835 [bacterium]|nr:hypothetical protein [bacterium]
MKILTFLFIIFTTLMCIRIYAEMVTSTVNGTVKYISEINKVVRKGKPLVKFSKTGIKIQIEMLKLDLKKAEEFLKDKKTDIKRSKSLNLKSSVSLAEYENVIFEYHKGHAQYEILKLEMKDLELELKSRIILAPYDSKVINTIIILNSGVELGQKILEIKRL